MTTIEQNFTANAGNDVNLNVTITESDGSAKDLTNVNSITWYLGKSTGSVFTLKKTIGSGIVVVDAVAGQLRVELEEADTENLRGIYFHSCVVNDENDDTVTVLKGTVLIEQSQKES